MPEPKPTRKMLSEVWMVAIGAARSSAMPGMAGRYMSMARGGSAAIAASRSRGGLMFIGSLFISGNAGTAVRGGGVGLSRLERHRRPRASGVLLRHLGCKPAPLQAAVQVETRTQPRQRLRVDAVPVEIAGFEGQVADEGSQALVERQALAV